MTVTRAGMDHILSFLIDSVPHTYTVGSRLSAIEKELNKNLTIVYHQHPFSPSLVTFSS
jgi:hypothetical protein